MSSAVVSPVLNTTDPSEINVGDVMSFTYFGEVEKVNSSVVGGTTITLTDLDSGQSFQVQGNELLERSKSASQYKKTERVTQGDMVDILCHAKNSPFTVVFVKKDGSTRTLVGRVIGISEKNLGYIAVEDLERPSGDRFRQVDCRTIQHLVLNNIKYVVK